MARSKSVSGIYVAKSGFACEIGDDHYNVVKGERVREGHALLRANPERFEPLETGRVQYDVEQAEQKAQRSDVEDASASPGTKRNR